MSQTVGGETQRQRERWILMILQVELKQTECCVEYFYKQMENLAFYTIEYSYDYDIKC